VKNLHSSQTPMTPPSDALGNNDAAFLFKQIKRKRIDREDLQVRMDVSSFQSLTLSSIP
jgi:hypothetical protein